MFCGNLWNVMFILISLTAIGQLRGMFLTSLLKHFSFLVSKAPASPDNFSLLKKLCHFQSSLGK